MSRSKTALVHLNTPFSETLSLLILRINHYAHAGICPHIPAGCALVSYSKTSPDSETDIIYKLIQMSDMKNLTPTGTKGATWMNVSVEPHFVQLCPIDCDAHRSLWKQHGNLDFLSPTNKDSSACFEMWTGYWFWCIFRVLYKDFSLTSFSRCPLLLCICFLWVVQRICTAGALMKE